MNKLCIACGMPMKTPSEHALNDESKDYCSLCANPDGSMHTFEQKVESMTAYLVKSKGMDRKDAAKLVSSLLAKLPAWKDRF